MGAITRVSIRSFDPQYLGGSRDGAQIQRSANGQPGGTQPILDFRNGPCAGGAGESKEEVEHLTGLISAVGGRRPDEVLNDEQAAGRQRAAGADGEIAVLGFGEMMYQVGKQDQMVGVF